MSSGVKRFVRDTLGCTCPDAVFNHIDSRRKVVLGELTLSRRIDVGHRLLVYLLESDDPDFLGTRLPDVVALGQAERDREGFNRLRVVVATGNSQPVSLVAQRAFDHAAGRDERLHLHVVDKAAIARL